MADTKITTADVINMRDELARLTRRVDELGQQKPDGDRPKEYRVVLQQSIATGFGLALGAAIVAPVVFVVFSLLSAVVLSAFSGPAR